MNNDVYEQLGSILGLSGETLFNIGGVVLFLIFVFAILSNISQFSDAIKKDFGKKKKGKEEMINNLGKRAGKITNLVKQKEEELIQKHWEKVEKLTFEELKVKTVAKIQDDEVMCKVFGTVYENLPVAVKFVIKRDRFVNFCMSKKSILIESYLNEQCN